MTKTMGSHQSSRMLTDVWLTPKPIIDALGPFNLDPCAAPVPRPWRTADAHICLPEDGLAANWGTARVYCNPPYGREAVRWLAKLADHGKGTALTFARTETHWFVDTVWSKATAVLFLHGRIHFCHPDGTPAAANAGAPSVLAAYGWYDAARLSSCGLAGTFIRLSEAAA